MFKRCSTVVRQFRVIEIRILTEALVTTALTGFKECPLSLRLFTGLQVAIGQMIVGTLPQIISSIMNLVKRLDGFFVPARLVQNESKLIVVLNTQLAAQLFVFL